MNFYEAETNSQIVNSLIEKKKLPKNKKQISSSKSNGIVYSASLEGIPVILKTSNITKDFSDVEHEWRIGSVLNRMRTLVPNFVYTYGKFSDGTHDYTVLEDLKGISLFNYLYMDKIKDFGEFIDITLQILLALELAQREFHFTHFDLHCNNVMLLELNEPMEYSVMMDTYIYKVKTRLVPVIIDYGFSTVFIDDEVISENNRVKNAEGGYTVTDSGKNIEESGILPFMVQGIDMYRFLTSCIKYMKNGDFKRRILSFFGLYNKDDPYSINLENLQDTQKEFVKRVVWSKAGNYTPLDMITYIWEHIYSGGKIRRETRNIYVDVSNLNRDDNFLDGIEECINKSYSYIISLFNLYLIPDEMEKQIRVLREWINKNSAMLKYTDDKMIDYPKQNELPILREKIFDILNNITLASVKVEDEVKLNNFVNEAQIYIELENVASLSWMAEQIGVENEKLEIFRTSRTFEYYSMEIRMLRRALRWCWTLIQEINYLKKST